MIDAIDVSKHNPDDIRHLKPPAIYRREPKMPVFVFPSNDADETCRIMYEVPGTIVACQKIYRPKLRHIHRHSAKTKSICSGSASRESAL